MSNLAGNCLIDNETNKSFESYNTHIIEYKITIFLMCLTLYALYQI